MTDAPRELPEPLNLDALLRDLRELCNEVRAPSTRFVTHLDHMRWHLDQADKLDALITGLSEWSRTAASRRDEGWQPIESAPRDEELPGMWSAADFTGGDPDERSHAERSRAVNLQKWSEVWDLLHYAERQWAEWKTEDAEAGDAYCAHTARQHEHYVAALRQILMGEKGDAR